MIKLAPSLLAADFANLEREIAAIEKAGAHYLHLDVMDGHFVPNITIGPPVIKALRKVSGITFDVHLMIKEPERYIGTFAEAGADIINVHAEACGDIEKIITDIKGLGKKAGVTIKPGTPVNAVLPVLETVDLILVMSVEPGFGGQKLIESTLSKITELKEIIKERKLAAEIEIDGGVNLSNIKTVLASGADVVVAGEAVFGSGDVKKAVETFISSFEGFEASK